MKYWGSVCLLLLCGVVQAQQALITVKGEGSTQVAPDFVEVTGVVYTESKTVDEAKRDADQRGRSVIQAIKKFKIADKDLAFSGVSIQRKVEYDRNSNQKIVGFSVNRSITIKLRKLATYELLVEALSRAGISEVRAPVAGVDDEHALKTAALKEATHNAKRKATEVAAGLGVKVGSPFEIGEERLPSQMPFNQKRASRAEADMMRATPAQSGGSYDPLLFVPQNIVVNATVWVSFKIES